MRILNPSGVGEFQVYIEAGAKGPVPLNLLESDKYSEEFLGGDVEYPEIAACESKSDLTELLRPIFDVYPVNKILYNREFWASLSLKCFDIVAPADANGSRKPGMLYRHIPPEGRNFRQYYRHLIRTPAWISFNYGNDSRIFLATKPWKGGDFIEQIASRQELITNKEIVSLLDTLYFDAKKKTYKRSSTGANPGALRRLVPILQQFELTYDLHAMKADDFLRILPKEFDSWKPTL